MPAVVAQRAEECLVDCPAGELVREGVLSEHVGDRVWLALYLEAVHLFNVILEAVRPRLAGVYDEAVIIRLLDWPGARPELTDEEVVPGYIAVVLSSRIADIG